MTRKIDIGGCHELNRPNRLENEMNEHDYSLPSQEDTDAYPVDAAGTYTGVML